jgi:hypothetical protein
MVEKIRKILLGILLAFLLIGIICIVTGFIGEIKLFRIVIGVFFIGGGIIAYKVGNDKFKDE